MTSAQPMTIAITGATGFVGRHTASAIAEQGHTVRALARDPEKARRTLPEKNTTTIIADVFDRHALAELADGADAVVHTIGIRREVSGGGTFGRLHADATRAVLEATRAAGIRRFIHVSALGTRPDAPCEYWRSKHQAERLVRSSGLDWTILRPSIIHGHDGELVGMVRDWVLGRAAPRMFIPYFARIEFDPDRKLAPPRLGSASIQPIHVGDVARAIIAAIDAPEAVGEVYNLVGPDTLDWPGFLSQLRDAMPIGDKDKPVRPVPAPLALAAARIAGVIGIAGALPFGPSEPVMAVEDSTASFDKARSHLGIDPASFAKSLAAYASKI